MKYLTPNDFYISQQSELAVKIPGFSFIFFSSVDTCSHCKDFMPIFFQVENSLHGCTFGIMNVDQENRKIVSISEKTKNRLTYVPFLVFYINGIPREVYSVNEIDLKSNIEGMRNWLLQQISHVQRGVQKVPLSSKYSTGIAYNKKKRVCYLNSSKAYVVP